MVQIGELAFKTRFDGRALTQGLMSSRQQMSFARKEMEALKTPAQKYGESLDNVNAIIAKYPGLESNRLKYMKQAALSYLEQTEAVRKLTAAEKIRMDQLRGSLGIKQPATDTKKPGMLGGLAGAAGAAGLGAGTLGIGAAAATATKSLALAADAQRTENLLAAMTQSRAVAKGLIDDMRQLSKATGIKMSGLQDSARTMLAFGVETRKVTPMLTALGNIAMGDSERLKGLSLAFSQVAAIGRLTGEEVAQMTERGFNPLVYIAKQTGESMTDLRKRMSEGRVSFAELEAAVILATSAGQRFYGTAAAGNQGLAGSFNKFSNEVELLSTNFGEKLAPAVETVVNALSNGLPILNSWVEGVGAIATGFKTAADLAGSIVPPSVKDAAGAALSANPVSALSLVPNLFTALTAKSRGYDESVGMDAADRVRKTLGKGFWSKENNQRIDDFQKNRKEKQQREEEVKAWNEANPTRKVNSPYFIERFKEQDKLEAERKQKEAERANTASSMTKGLADRLELDKWNRDNPKTPAHSMEELEAIKSMNAEERKRLDLLQAQSELVDKLRDDQDRLKQIMGAGSLVKEANQAEWFRKELDKIEAESKAKQDPKADPTREQLEAESKRQQRIVTKLADQPTVNDRLREQLEAESKRQQRIVTQLPVDRGALLGKALEQLLGRDQSSVPDSLLAPSDASGARSIQVGSAEAARYMDDLKKMQAGKPKDDQNKELKEIVKKLDAELAEMKKQTRLQEKLTEVSPRLTR